jgi:hypothetical protein
MLSSECFLCIIFYYQHYVICLRSIVIDAHDFDIQEKLSSESLMCFTLYSNPYVHL